MARKENSIRRAGKGWKSSEQLANEFLASPRRIRQELEILREAIIGDMAALDYPEAEASALVEYNLIGQRQTAGGGRPTLQANPDIIRLLKIRPRHLTPQAEADWKSAQRLRELYYGDSATINRKLEKLRHELIADAISNGETPEAAAASVERSFVGLRRPALGPAALHASPESVERLEQKGILRRREIQAEDEAWVERENQDRAAKAHQQGRQ